MKDKIQEIRESLAKATPGPWEWSRKEWTLNSYDGYEIGDLEHKINSKSAELILCIENNEYGRPIITTGIAENAQFIANAPEWLRWCLSELEETNRKLTHSQNNMQMAVSAMEAKEEENQKLREQLQAAKETLQWYADESNWKARERCGNCGHQLDNDIPKDSAEWDCGGFARDTLKQIGAQDT